MSERKFDAVLFDIDGTLLNTREFIFQAFEYSIKHHLKKKIDREELVKTTGLHLEKSYRILTGLEDVKDLMVTHDEFQYRNFQLITPFQKTLQTLKTLGLSKVRMGAVTNRYGEQVLRSLKLADLDKYIDVIVTPLDVKNPKPHPESIYKALKKLDVVVRRTLVVGDSPLDIQAGKAAGCLTIGASYGYFGQRLIESKPDFLVSDISEILPIILR